MKVVINVCFGGFGLSCEATQWLWEQGVTEIGTPAVQYFGGPGSGYHDQHKKDDTRWKERMESALKEWRNGAKWGTQFTPDEKYCLYVGYDFPRNHPKLIECVEKFGEKANGLCAQLEIVDIPDGIEWEVEEYDGSEHVAEKHRTWR